MRIICMLPIFLIFAFLSIPCCANEEGKQEVRWVEYRNANYSLPEWDAPQTLRFMLSSEGDFYVVKNEVPDEKICSGHLDFVFEKPSDDIGLIFVFAAKVTMEDINNYVTGSFYLGEGDASFFRLHLEEDAFGAKMQEIFQLESFETLHVMTDAP